MASDHGMSPSQLMDVSERDVTELRMVTNQVAGPQSGAKRIPLGGGPISCIYRARLAYGNHTRAR
eukprot:2611173-Pleurochrysis_carterae.AAC.3